MKTKRFLFLIAIICIIGYASCRKTDQLIEVQTKELSNDFFAVSLSADPSVKKIADKIRLQNEKVPFLKDFIENQGVAIWDKATVMRQAPLPASTNNVSEGIINDTTSFVMIPLVRSGEKHVHGALACKVAGDSVTIHLLDGSEYNWYNQHTDSAGYTGDQLSLMLMQLDETVFGHTLFKIRDSTAFVGHKGDRTRYIKLQPAKNNAIVQRWELKIMTIHYSTFEDLFEGQLHGCEPGDEHCNEYQEVFHSVSYQQYVWVDDNPFPNPWYDPHESGGGHGETPWVPVEDNSPGDIGGPSLLDDEYRPYTLTAADAAILNQIELEDAVQDVEQQNRNCQGTQRTGNYKWPGTIEHWLIMLDYCSTDPVNHEIEYAIPGSSASGNRGYADLVNSFANEIFEIKPNNPAGIDAGKIEVTNYVNGALLNCPTPNPFHPITPGWHKGTSYPAGLSKKIPSHIPLLDLEITWKEPGVVVYNYVARNPAVPQPVVIPSSVLDKLRNLVKRLKDHVGDAKEVITGYLREHPELVTTLKTIAYGAAVSIIVGTILEDIATLGVGIADDWASFSLAFKIIRIARAM